MSEAEKIMEDMGFRFKGFTKWEKEVVLKYLRGKTLNRIEISKRLNTSPQLVAYYMRKFGIK